MKLCCGCGWKNSTAPSASAALKSGRNRGSSQFSPLTSVSSSAPLRPSPVTARSSSSMASFTSCTGTAARPASAARHAERGTRCAWMSMLFMRRALHRLLDPLRHHLGCEGSSPVGVARQYGVDGAQTVIGAGDAARRAALADRLHRLQQQTPSLDHRLVGGTEMLASAIDDAAHALLDRAI